MSEAIDEAAKSPVSIARIRFAAPANPAFYPTLRARVGAYLDNAAKGRFADRPLLLKAAFYLAVVVAAYAMLLIRGDDTPRALFYGMVYGVGTLLLAINIGHDAAHHAVSGRRGLDRLIMILSFAPVGVDSYLWQMRHVKSHHAFPNVNGCDIDIDDNPFLRLSPNHPRRAYQRYQHFYAPFIFWLVSLHTIFVQDFQYLFKKRLANMTNIRHPASAYALFALCKIAYLLLTFAIPIALLPFPWWYVVIGAVLMSFVSSMLFVYLFIGTHFAEMAEFPDVGPSGELGHDWARHAMVTSVDWNPDSRWAYFIAGGANTHAAHHLFPQVSHAHYRAISRIIRQTAAEFGMTYNVTRLGGMIRSHFRFLRRMAAA